MAHKDVTAALDRILLLSRRQELVNATVTLDGEPAKVRGYNRPYASVRSATRSVEFAWETVELIVTTRDGAFHS